MSKYFNRSVLARRILILCLSLVLAVSFILSWRFLTNLAGVNSRNLRATADITMRYLNLDVQNAIEPALNLANSVSAMVSEMDTLSGLDSILASMMTTVPAAFEIYYGTTLSRFDGGAFITATDWDPYATNPEWDQIKRPWFITSMQNPGRTVITDPYEDSSTGKICVTMVKTVSAGNSIIGVVGVDVFLDVLTEIVTSRTITSDGSTFIINSDGLYLVHNNGDYIMNRNFYETEGAGLQKAASSNVEVIVTGNTYLASMPMSGMDWLMVTTGSTEELNRDFWKILISTIILGLAMVLVVVIVSLRFSMLLTRAIVRLFGVLKTIAAGDFTQQIDAKGSDEITQMTLLLRETQESIKNLIFNVKEEADALSGIGNDLAIDMNETASSMNEITASVQSIKGRILKQSASVIETHETLEKVVNNINDLNGHVENQSINISQASSAIEQMVANINSVTGTLVSNASNVKTLLEASEAGRSGLSEVASDIQEIARESEGILEINSVMQNIASQTNLLSMNAAIEAAHAGESGKGFAVVADEIRKLAENSGEQSKTIGTVLKKIKSSIDKITSSTQNVLNKFEAIDSSVKTVAEQEDTIRSAMEEQEQGSRQILEGVENVNEITRKVKSSSNEMLEGAQVVIAECNDLEKATREITSGMNEMVTGAENINKAMNSANDTSNKNRNAIGMVIKEVSRFKVE